MTIIDLKNQKIEKYQDLKAKLLKIEENVIVQMAINDAGEPAKTATPEYGVMDFVSNITIENLRKAAKEKPEKYRAMELILSHIIKTKKPAEKQIPQVYPRPPFDKLTDEVMLPIVKFVSIANPLLGALKKQTEDFLGRAAGVAKTAQADDFFRKHFKAKLPDKPLKDMNFYDFLNPAEISS